MASKILLKKSTTASQVPTTLDLDTGEVAINTEDKRLFTKDSGGSIVEVSTTPSTMDVDGNTTVGGTLNVTGTTTLGTANITTATVSSALSVPTPTQDAHAASKGYVDTEVSSAVATVIDSSPAALDTLNELAAALGDDPNFSATITTSIGTKLPKDGSEAMSGNLDLGTNKVVNVVDPTSAQDAATKTYVDTADATKLNLSGGTMTGNITMGANSVTSTATPSTDDELTRKGYVDGILGSATSAADSATAAATSASEAATSASNASTSESNAATSATNAAASYDDFDDRYLGAKATAPAVDNDGDALITGALYFDTTAGAMYVYDGSAWDQVALTPGDFLTVNNNLSDLSNAATAISNLGITATAAELNYTDGVTSNIQTQIDNIDVDPTKGTLTKSFINGETASITLSGAISPAPVVSVTKEVSQVGVSSKGSWDVATDGANYELHDTAYDTTLTPGSIGIAVQNSTYASKSVDVSGTDGRPHAVFFKPDGTKMYTVGDLGDKVFEYNLSTAYDVSTATYSSNSFTVSGQDGNTYALCFSTDGTKMYTGGLNSYVYEYTLSTAWDVSTASYSSNSLYVGGQSTNIRGLFLKSDGTKIFVCLIGNDTVFEYDISTAYDLSTASYSSNSISVASNDTTPNALAFTSDGLSFCIAGENSDTIYQYDMTTAWDVSTASDSGNSFLISAQETTVTGLHIIDDDNKMYIVGEPGTVYQYTLGSKDGLVLGSGSFASTDVGKRIVGNGGEAILTATDGSYSEVTAFNDSSTIASGSWSMYALTFDGTDGVKINTLDNGFQDASTWTYDSVSFSVASQETEPRGLIFNNDGTKMYLIGVIGDSVYQYSLSTAFDLSTASYDSVSFSITSQDNNPQDIKFNNDGTKLYLLGNANDTIYQYSLSTAYDVSTMSYDSVSFSITGQETTPNSIVFNNDGTKLYLVGSTGDDVNQYTLSTAFDLSTASFDSVTFSVSAQETTPTSIAFNSDGTKMYILGSTGDDVNQYTLSTAFDISTASFDSVTFSVSSQDSEPQGIVFNNTGTKMYILGTNGDTIEQYTTGTAYVPTSQYSPTVTKASGQIDTGFWTDINTMTADETLNGGEVYYAVSTDDRTTWAVIDDTDGVRPIVRNNAGTWEYNDASTYGGTTWTSATTNEELYALQEALEDGVAEEAIGFADASTWSYDSVSFSVNSEDTQPIGLKFNNDGTKMYIVGNTNDSVYQYTLSTAYDVSTTSYDSVSFSTASQEISPTDITFNNDGTKMYIVGTGGDDVNEYALSTAYDISTASFTTNFSVLSQDTNAQGLFFNNDGTKMYILGNTGDDVNQYTLSTGFDISTASFDSVTFSIASQETAPTHITFNNDGTKMYIGGISSGNIHQYSLSTAYDLSTASYDSQSFSITSQETAPRAMAFNNDGTKIYVVGTGSVTVFQYSTGTTGNFNRMNSTQLNAVTDPNHYTLGDTLDLAIMLYTASAGSIPESDGVSINYDAAALNQGAVVGTDYDFDFPDSTTVRITSNAAQNLKVRVV